jgi:hypothetical protein
VDNYGNGGVWTYEWNPGLLHTKGNSHQVSLTQVGPKWFKPPNAAKAQPDKLALAPGSWPPNCNKLHWS